MNKVLCITIAAMMASAAYACDTCGCADNGDVGDIGVGYQGVVLGNLLNGIAIRGKPAPIGWQVELVQGMAELSGGSPLDLEADLLVLKGKGYIALIERDNSVFYTGASIGYWAGEIHPDLGAKNEIDGWSIAPLIGAEWNFAELPELGINFEVSYELNMLEDDVEGAGTAEIDLYGITVSTGIIYYF